MNLPDGKAKMWVLVLLIPIATGCILQQAAIIQLQETLKRAIALAEKQGVTINLQRGTIKSLLATVEKQNAANDAAAEALDAQSKALYRANKALSESTIESNRYIASSRRARASCGFLESGK